MALVAVFAGSLAGGYTVQGQGAQGTSPGSAGGQGTNSQGTTPQGAGAQGAGSQGRGAQGSGAQGSGVQGATRGTQAGPLDARGFIEQMAVAGMAEVQLGKLAAERASNDDVKAFGQMMVKDHTQANQELMQIASRMNVQPPTQLDAKHRELAERLSKLQGDAFDREYMTAMVQGHEEVLSHLRARAGSTTTSTGSSTTGAQASSGGGASSSGAGTQAGRATQGSGGASSVGTAGTAGDRAGEQQLNAWAAKTTPVVQQHLERARSIQQKVK